MRRAVKIALGCLLSAAVVFTSVTHAEFFGGRNRVATADAVSPYFVDSNGKIALPSKDATQARGSEGNPLFILEIVPYDGLAEFGYQIAGCEPVDMDWMAWEGKALPDNGALITNKSVFAGFWEDELPAGYDKHQEAKYPYLGTMKMTTGEGNYKVSDSTDEYIEIKDEAYSGTRYKKDGENFVEDTAGDYQKVTKLTFEKEENGGYTFTPLNVAEVHAMTDEEKTKYADVDMAMTEGESIKVDLGEKKAYVNHSAAQYTHKNQFLKYAIGLAYEMKDGKRYNRDPEEVEQLVSEYHSVVYTVTPEDLNMNVDLIDLADMIIISGSAKMGNKPDDKFFRTDLFGHDDSTNLGKKILNKTGADFVSNPIDWEVAKRIFAKATAPGAACPVLIETQSRTAGQSDNTKTVNFKKVYSDGSSENSTISGTQNNMYKLLLMLLQMENTTFYQMFADADGKVLDGANFGETTLDGTTLKKKDGTSLKTGTFKLNQSGTGVKYWEKELFYPYHVVAKSEFDTDAEKSNVLNMFGIANNKEPYNWQSGAMQTAVRDSLFQYDGSNLASDKMHADKIEDKTVATEDDLFGYEVYDFIQNTDPTGSRPAKVDTADVIWYMMNGLNSPDNPNLPIHADIRILDVEPASVYTKEATYFKTLFGAQGNLIGNVTVDHINTAELIGKRLEPLGEYDMIFIGTNIGANDDYNFLPSGMIYSHTGKTIEISGKKGMYNILGSGDDNIEKNFAYSGNDITKLVLDRFTACRNEGLLFMYGDGFFNDYDLTKAEISGSIDHNSYMFEFANVNISKALYENAFQHASDYGVWTREKNKLKASLANIVAKRVRLDFTSDPTRYAKPDTYKDMSKSDAENYINPNATQTPTLEFKFKLDAPAGVQYSVRLYMDANGDGTFTENENIGASVYLMKTDGNRGAHEGSGKVEGGKEYILQREIEGRIGSINWKLDLVRNDVVYCTMSGLSAIKAHKAEDIDDLPILQILPKNQKTSDGKEILLPDATDLANYISSHTNSNSITKKFLEGIYNTDGTSKINGLNITFTRYKEDAIITAVQNKVGPGVTPTADDYLAFLKDYKMVVSGFADMYDGISNADLLEALDRYMKLGYAILYTHDNSSFTGVSNSSPAVWGKNMTDKFRNSFGMDRYDVMLYGANQLSATRADYPWKHSDSATDRSDMVKKNNYLLIQGYTNATLLRFHSKGGNNANSSKIKVINEGAVTSYPYDIPDIASTVTTHPQYFQLNMEDPNINVWYTVYSNSGTNWYDKTFMRIEGDVRNNYYIYNIGNVTYSGVGHNGNLTDDEVKLFINTFVAAYRAAAKAVSIVVVNDDASGKDGEYFLCTDLDSSDASKLIGNEIYEKYALRTHSGTEEGGYTYTKKSDTTGVSKRVYFYIKDNNSYGNGRYTLKTSVAGVTSADEDLAIYAKDGTFVGTSSAFRSGYGHIYYVDVPIHFETVGGKTAAAQTKVEFSITPWYTVNGGVTSPGSEISTVTIMPRGLFNLD